MLLTLYVMYIYTEHLVQKSFDVGLYVYVYEGFSCPNLPYEGSIFNYC